MGYRRGIQHFDEDSCWKAITCNIKNEMAEYEDAYKGKYI